MIRYQAHSNSYVVDTSRVDVYGRRALADLEAVLNQAHRAENTDQVVILRRLEKRLQLTFRKVEQ